MNEILDMLLVKNEKYEDICLFSMYVKRKHINALMVLIVWIKILMFLGFQFEGKVVTASLHLIDSC